MKNSNNQRFRDPNSDYLAGPALVICPRCSGAAQATAGAVACTCCGFARAQVEPQFNAQPVVLTHTAWKPRCTNCGASLPKMARRVAKGAPREVSIGCPQCNKVATYAVHARHRVVAPNCDPVSGLPYYLSTPFGAHMLWVRNLEHLNVLEAYVAATLRERSLEPSNMTWLARLPAWLKSSHNRSDLGKALTRLQSKASIDPKR